MSDHCVPPGGRGTQYGSVTSDDQRRENRRRPRLTDRSKVDEPLVLIPGIQGRWEWMAPAVTALSRTCRVVTESLPGDQGSSSALDTTRGFDTFVDWLDELLERNGLEQASVCGVSYGGLIALRYAARRPERVARLILASTPSPSWTPNCRIERYLRAPRLMSSIFAFSSPFRLYPEIAAAFPRLSTRAAFCVRHLRRVTKYRFAPTTMAERVRLLTGTDFAADCARVRAPTLVVTGSTGLDRVVDIADTREYVGLIPGARWAEVAGTGHIGLVTRPDRFAAAVSQFLGDATAVPSERRRVSA